MLLLIFFGKSHLSLCIVIIGNPDVYEDSNSVYRLAERLANSYLSNGIETPTTQHQSKLLIYFENLLIFIDSLTNYELFW
jgi:hypothetical protein